MALPVPEWYPSKKYVHDGKDVLRILWEFDLNRGSTCVRCKIAYTDGSAEHCQEPHYDKVREFARSLAEKLGFVIHTTQDVYDFPVSIPSNKHPRGILTRVPINWEAKCSTSRTQTST